MYFYIEEKHEHMCTLNALANRLNSIYKRKNRNTGDDNYYFTTVRENMRKTRSNVKSFQDKNLRSENANYETRLMLRYM
jgi:steroid 5-alpha reductase family enzyme